MLTPRRLFLELGGFDERALRGRVQRRRLRLPPRGAGLRCVYAPRRGAPASRGPFARLPDDPRESGGLPCALTVRARALLQPQPVARRRALRDQPRRAFVAAPPGPVRALMCAFNLNWEGAPYSQFEMTVELKRRGILEPVVYAPADGPLRAAYEREGIAVHVATHPLAGVSTAHDYDAAIDRFCALDPHARRRARLRQHAADVLRDRRRPRDRVAVDLEPARERAVAGILPPVSRRGRGARARAAMRIPTGSCSSRTRRPQGSAALDTRHNFTVIHNGLDRRRLVAAAAGHRSRRARRELGVAPDDIVLLLLGTVCERKGQHDLAQRARSVAGRCRGCASAYVLRRRPREAPTAGHCTTLVGELPTSAARESRSCPRPARSHATSSPPTSSSARRASRATRA